VEGSFVAFLGIAVVVIVTPGQDTALTIRNTLLGGRRAGLATALGVAVGQSTWTVATSVGLTAILVASEPAFVALRLGGSAYLVWLGLQSIRAGLRPAAGRLHDPVGTPQPGSMRRAWRQGVLSSLGNPKLAVFFSSLLPQFAPPGSAALETMLALGAVFVAMTVAWLSFYAAVTARAGDLLRRGPVRRLVDGVMGAVLVLFGGRLALNGR
jgi:threonine/homoserine/homoserine lactone efflux protein